MRIALCSLTYPLPNGVTSSINESLDGFLAAGHEVIVISPNYDKAPVRPEHRIVASSQLIELVTNPLGNSERFFGWRAGRQIRSIIKSFQPDAFWLHTVSPVSNVFERQMIKSNQSKVLTYHTMLENYGRTYLGPIGAQQMVRRSAEICNSVDTVITPSQYMAGRLEEYGVIRPIEVIASGIEPIDGSYTKAELAKRFNFSPDNDLLIFVGRVVKEKNIGALLKMLADLVKLRPTVTLLLVGPGDIEGTKKEAEELGVAANLAFTDQLPLAEARKCYGGADIFVFASQTETQGLVVGEAMSVGVPVVALKSPIQKEVYPDDVAVVVYDEKLFASEVDKLLKDAPRMKLLATKGKQFVTKHFSKEIMIERQIAVFEALVHPTA